MLLFPHGTPRFTYGFFAPLLMTSVLAVACQAQSSLSPATPIATGTVQSGQTKSRERIRPPVSAVSRSFNPVHPNLFATAVATHWAGIIFDAATTHHGLGHCREANPLYGSRPSNGRVLAPLVSISAAYTALSLRHRRKHPESKAPVIGNFVIGGAHIVVGMLNTRCF